MPRTNGSTNGKNRTSATMPDLRKDPVIAKLAKATGGARPSEGRDYVRLIDGEGRTVAWVLRRKNYARVIGLKKKPIGVKLEGHGKTKGVLVTEDNVDKVATALHKLVAA